MAGTNLLASLSAAPKVLYSGQLASTAETVVYTAPTSPAGSTVLKHGSLCNISAGSVTVSLSILQSGQATGTGTHRVINSYPLGPNDTLPLNEYIGDACLGTGDFVAVTASVANVVDVILSGIENT